jgi:predicted N-acetyltransferase YhbS
MYRFELLSDLQIPLVNKFYKQCRYSSKAGRGEVIFVLKGDSGIVAAVRLEPKNDGWYFLRAMCVAPDLRGQGVGSQLLKSMDAFLSSTPVYCFPFDHLCEFYSRASFVLCPADSAPSFVKDACLRYQQQGRKICIMANQPFG